MLLVYDSLGDSNPVRDLSLLIFGIELMDTTDPYMEEFLPKVRICIVVWWYTVTVLSLGIPRLGPFIIIYSI